MHQIGVGVLGSVFRASHPEGDRPVAVKTFQFDIAPEQVERFAGALAHVAGVGLSHPAVVAALDVGIQSGIPYLVSDYAPGESLDVVLRRDKAASLARALTIARGLAAAVDAAHARGVVHGALHLRDVLVAGDAVRVTGFGVASALEHAGLRAPVRRPYAAPELVAGRRWGPEADRFAVAAIAYELLTGTRAAGTGDELLVRLRDLEAAGVADRAGLQQAFRNGLAADPEIRPAAAAGFVAAFGAALGAAAGDPGVPDGGQAPDAPRDDARSATRLEPDPPRDADGRRAGPATGSDAIDAPAGDTARARPAPAREKPVGLTPAREKPMGPTPARTKPASARTKPAPADARLPLSAEDEPAAAVRPSGDAGPIAAGLAGMTLADPIAAREAALADAGVLDRPVAAPEAADETAGRDAGTSGDETAGRDAGTSARVPPPERSPRRAAPPVWTRFRAAAPAWSSLLAAAAVVLAMAAGVIGAWVLSQQLGTSDEAAGPTESESAPPAATGGAGPRRAWSEGVVRDTGTPDSGATAPPPAAAAPAPGSLTPGSPAPAPAAAAPAPFPPPLDPALLFPAPFPPPLDPAPAEPDVPAASPRPPEPVTGTGLVLVRASPPGAAVALNGEERGVSPLSIPDVPYGTHRVAVSAPGYEPRTLEVVVSAADRIAAVGVTLAPIAAVPAGAPAPESAAPGNRGGRR